MLNQALRVGLKFRTTHFASPAEVSEIREDKNEIDIIFTPSDGHAWEAKNWNLAIVKLYFERGEYKIEKPDPANISVY